jgi:hypothetical protein
MINRIGFWQEFILTVFAENEKTLLRSSKAT